MRRFRFSVTAVACLALASLFGGPVAPAAASTVAATGTLAGTVTVTGAPANFSGEVGVGACPASTPPHTVCANPQYALVGASGGSFTLSLPAGRWRAAGFYELAFFGGQFIGPFSSVTVSAGTTTTHDFTVPYRAPGAVQGTVAITGVPAGVTLQSTSAVACPASNPYTGGIVPIVCVYNQGPPGASYQFTTLPPGPLLYPQYTTLYGVTTSSTATKVKVVAGTTITKNLTAAYQTPTDGLVTGTVTVTGAPRGFGAYSGALACQGAGTAGCAAPSTSQPISPPNADFQLLVPAGTWSVSGDYQLNFGGGVFTGPGQNVAVQAGATTTVNLVVPYVAPGTVIGKVDVTHIPVGKVVQYALVVACPATQPYVPPLYPGVWCAEYGTPLVAQYSLTTLPPGAWLLYPGFQSATSQYISPKGIPVTVTSNTVVTRNLKVAFR
jgi:hypothetical protein